MPTLYSFAGLPGTGKSTLARSLAGDCRAVYLRIDTIEQAARDAGLLRGPEGYLIAYAVAVDNLRSGRNVVADSVNPLGITRNAWRDVAERCKSGFVEIEVICSDAAEHQSRVEARSTDIPNLRLPTWSEVVNREYEPWDRSHIVIDTSGLDVGQSVAALQRSLSPDSPEGLDPAPGGSVSQDALTRWAEACRRINHLDTLVQREIAAGSLERARQLAERARVRAWNLFNDMVRAGARKPEGYREPDEEA